MGGALNVTCEASAGVGGEKATGGLACIRGLSRAQMMVLGQRRQASFITEGEKKDDMCPEAGKSVGYVGCP